MPDRAAIIQQATLRARRDWLRYSIRQEREIFTLFKSSADRIIAQIDKFAVAGKVPPARLVLLLDTVSSEMKLLRPNLARKITQSMSKSVDYGLVASIKGAEVAQLGKRIKIGIGTSFIGKDGVVRRFDPRQELYRSSVWAKVSGDAMDSLVRYRPSGLTFSQAVWDVTWQSQKSIRNTVNQAVLLGEPSSKLSRDIRGFLHEPEKLFRRVRKDGKLVLSKTAAEYHPGLGTYRSSYKNAMRLARTEMARAYHEGAIRYAEQKKWIDGGIWRTGSANPCPICADLDGQFFKKADIPSVQHPHCFCYVDWHIEGDEKPER